MKAIRLLVLTALFVVLTSALSGTANAQYLILSSSNVFDPATGEVVAFSRTEMDYWSAGYYNAYVKGDIYSGSNTTPSATGEIIPTATSPRRSRRGTPPPRTPAISYGVIITCCP